MATNATIKAMKQEWNVLHSWKYRPRREHRNWDPFTRNDPRFAPEKMYCHGKDVADKYGRPVCPVQERNIRLYGIEKANSYCGLMCKDKMTERIPCAGDNEHEACCYYMPDSWKGDCCLLRTYYARAMALTEEDMKWGCEWWKPKSRYDTQGKRIGGSKGKRKGIQIDVKRLEEVLASGLLTPEQVIYVETLLKRR